MATIHPTAIVEAGAELDDSVSIDAYSIVRKHVRIGAGTRVGPHTLIEGHTTIGRDNRIHQSCSIGTPPQDKKYAGEPTGLEIGDRNTIREFCSIHIGTIQDEGKTWIGDDNWIMAYVHIAHDCRVGSQTIIASFAGLAGHVHLGDWAIVGGQSGLHQFVNVLIAFGVAASRSVGVGQLINEGHAGPARKDSVEIHLFENHAAFAGSGKELINSPDTLDAAGRAPHVHGRWLCRLRES